MLPETFPRWTMAGDDQKPSKVTKYQGSRQEHSAYAKTHPFYSSRPIFALSCLSLSKQAGLWGEGMCGNPKTNKNLYLKMSHHARL
jgi:hypothetical protein